MIKKVLKILFICITTLFCITFFACKGDSHIHSYIVTKINATCLKDGFTQYACDCGEIYYKDKINALGHNFEKYVSDGNATEFADGTKTAECTRCKEKNTIVDVGSKITESTKLAFRLNSDNQSYTVTGIGLCQDSVLNIPQKYNGLIVNEIADYAFENCETITKIIIPATITKIGRNAFYNCSMVEEVSLNTGLTYIGEKAFSDCVRIKELVIPNSVVEIGESAFYRCLLLNKITLSSNLSELSDNLLKQCINLKEIAIPEKILIIGSNALSHCNELLEITIPNNVIEIKEEAFAWNKKTTTVNIGKSVQKIAYNAFWENEALNSIKVHTENKTFSDDGNNLYNKDKSCLIRFVERKQADISLPDSVVKIEDYAFVGYDYFSNFTINDNITYVGDKAFYGCGNLTNVIIGENVIHLGVQVFYGCGKLVSVTFNNTVGWSKTIDNSSITKIDVSSASENAVQFKTGYRDYILFYLFQQNH